MNQWRSFGVRGMPTLKAYNGKYCGDTGRDGRSMKAKLDSCGPSPSPRPTPTPPRPTPRPTPTPTPSPGAQPLRNGGKDCWGSCRKGGFCPHFCGKGNACCRRGWSRDPAECRRAKFVSRYTGHHCVALSGGSPAPAPRPSPPPRPSPSPSGTGFSPSPSMYIRQSSSNVLSACPSQHGFRRLNTRSGPICLKQGKSDLTASAKAACQSVSSCKAAVTGVCRG